MVDTLWQASCSIMSSIKHRQLLWQLLQYLLGRLLRAAVIAESAMITTRVQRLIESSQAMKCGVLWYVNQSAKRALRNSSSQAAQLWQAMTAGHQPDEVSDQALSTSCLSTTCLSTSCLPLSYDMHASKVENSTLSQAVGATCSFPASFS